MTPSRIAFVAVLVVSVLAPRIVAAAPPAGRVIRVGVLDIIGAKFDPAVSAFARALVESLAEHGYVVGRHVTIDYRSSDGQPDRLPGLAAQLAAARLDVIVTRATGPTLAMKAATSTTPIVMVGAYDVVATGIVASLARPGGNVTGLGIDGAEISAKRMQLLREAVPRLNRVAVLWNATFRAMSLGYEQIEHAAPSLGVTVQSIRVTGSQDFEKAFAAMTQARPDGLVVLFGPMRGDDLPRIVDFVTRNRIPTAFELDRGVAGGGLMEFGPSFARLARRAGAYIDKIANGARPGDLPVEEPLAVDLVINLKAAKDLGLTMPQPLLLRADRLVE